MPGNLSFSGRLLTDCWSLTYKSCNYASGLTKLGCRNRLQVVLVRGLVERMLSRGSVKIVLNGLFRSNKDDSKNTVRLSHK
jgi:hypothetical protein